MSRGHVGFIGLGLMGAPMVRRLLQQGWTVSVWNLEPERYAQTPGAQPLASPAAVRAAADIVALCVLDGPAVESVCFGPEGLAAARSGADLLIDMSTIMPDDTLRLAAHLQQATGMGWVDAPISGGPALAAEGKLTIMAGGEAELFARAETVLRDLGENLTHMGPLGAGQTTKILNQAIVGASFVLMAEVCALANACKLNASRLPGALAGGLADSAVLQRILPQIANGAYEPPKGYARQLDKDLVNLLAFTQARGLSLPLIHNVVEHYHAWARDNAMRDSAAYATRSFLTANEPREA